MFILLLIGGAWTASNIAVLVLWIVEAVREAIGRDRP